MNVGEANMAEAGMPRWVEVISPHTVLNVAAARWSTQAPGQEDKKTFVINPDIRTHRTSMLAVTIGSERLGQMTHDFTWIARSRTDASPAALAPAMCGTWRAAGQTGSGLTVGIGALRHGSLATSQTGIGTATRL